MIYYRGECTEQCKSRRRELECEARDLRSTLRTAEERLTTMERERAAVAQQQHDTDILMSALSAMQDKNQHLEDSLSAETRIKLDLFSALGEAKRQLEIRESKFLKCSQFCDINLSFVCRLNKISRKRNRRT